MSRGKRGGAPAEEMQAVAEFLRALASRAEGDPTLARQIAAALRESGLLPAGVATSVPEPSARQAGPRSHTPGVSTSHRAAGEAPDPFVLLRDRGQEGLRAALEAMDLALLRQIVRTHRLDPARISARWSARERVIALIVDQVWARANHGKAFSRV